MSANMIVSLALTALITALIARAWDQKVFPFNGWVRSLVRNGNGGELGPKSPWDWLNLVFTAYNLYLIVSTWLALGIISLSALFYVLFIAVFFFVGWNWASTVLFVESVKAFGLKRATIDLIDRIRRALRIARDEAEHKNQD